MDSGSNSDDDDVNDESSSSSSDVDSDASDDAMTTVKKRKRPVKTAAKRKIANSFKPQSSWAIVDGVLQVLTPTPLGDRLETFPLNVEQSDEIDGQAWVKSHRWEGTKMITTATDPTKKKPDFVTERWIDGDDMLNQVNSHAGVAFTRYFKRDA